MNLDLLSLQALVVSGMFLTVILVRNSWRDRARRKREAQALAENIKPSKKTKTFEIR